MASKKKDLFDTFFDKNFGSDASHEQRISVLRPSGSERSTTYEQRREIAERESAAEAEAAAAAPEGQAASPAVEEPKSVEPELPEQKEGEGSAAIAENPRKGAGRPRRGNSGDSVLFNFLIDRKVKGKLEMLKISLFRSSIADLLMEAIRDLFIKYGVEDSSPEK